MYFSKVICHFLLFVLKYAMYKILDRVEFLLNYSNLFPGPLFIQIECIVDGA